MRIPFAVASYQSRSLPVSAQRTVNFYSEQAPPNAETPIYLIGTPGMLTFAGLGGTSVRAAIEWNGDLYAVAGTDLWSVASNGVVVSLGTLPAAGDVFMAANPTQLGILVGASLYVWNGSSLAQVSDTDFPGGSSFAYMDGFGIYTTPDTAQFGISDLNDFTAYDALDVATAEGEPDNLLRAFPEGGVLWLFGEKSVELWYDSGGADFPFARASGGVIKKGLLAKKAVAEFDNTVAWAGNDRVIYKADGTRPARISTHAIEKMLGDAATVSDAYAISYLQEGHYFWALTLPTAGFTIVYDAATQLWHERESRGVGYWRPSCYAYVYGKHIVGDSQSGNLYELSLDAHDEAGTTIVRSATSAPVHNNGARMFMPTLQIDVESGVGLTTGQGSDPQLMLDWSDDGGRTFGNERWASMGKIGEYRKRVRFNRLGSFRERVYRLTVSDPVKSIVIAAGD